MSQRQNIWHASNLILNTHADTEGQKLAFQNIKLIGAPHSICESMATHLNNKMIDKGWLMSIRAISESKDFWKIVNDSKGKITDLEMNFIAPNIFGGRDKTRDALRKLRDVNNAQNLSTKISNKEGALNPDTEEIHESIDYISEGGGAVRLKVGKKKVYDSDENATSKKVDHDDDFAVSEQNKNSWKTLIDRIFKS